MLERLNNFRKSIARTFRTNSTGDLFTLRNTEFGRVNVECSLIRRMVERSVSNVDGIHEISSTVEKPTEKKSLIIRYALILEQNYSAQSISADLVKATREVLENYFQIIDVEIYMRVTDVVQSVEKKNKRRVR